MSKNSQTFARLKRDRRRRLWKLIARVYFLQQRGRDEEIYNVVCDEFVALGGVYVKFLQGVLLNSPIMRKWHSPNRFKIFEDMDTASLDVVDILRHELPAKQLEQISLIQPEPFAAGSFGQVYFGQHQDGTPIIIKVLRPMIAELLRYDLRLLSIFGKRFVAHEYKNYSFNFKDTFAEFRHSTLRETDYIGEARFAAELHEAFKDDPQLVIPKTYLELCTTHVLVQEYVSGMSAVDLVKAKNEGEDPAEIVKAQLGSDLQSQLTALGTAMLSSSFNLPRMQGDPHPGNVRLLPDNKIALIDFGISAAAPERQAAFLGFFAEWNKLYDEHNDGDISKLFEQFIRFFVHDLYRALKKISGNNEFSETTSTKRTPLEEFTHMLQNVFSNAAGTSDIKTIMQDGQMMRVLGQLINKGNRFGMNIKLSATEMLRAIQTYMSLVEALGMRMEVLPKVFSATVQQTQASHPNLEFEADEDLSMTKALTILHAWLERVASHDPELFTTLATRLQLGSAASQSTTAIDSLPSADSLSPTNN
jgi:predicted unusual protein kinase regulating ubiquinone biosynthesis (AarF/ABC1/UbiB family)